MKKFVALILAAALAGPTVASNHRQAPLADGEVRKVDKNAQKITIRHGPIPSMDMPAMTMVYRAKEPAILDQVKAGDKVKFQAEKVDGVFTVTKIEPAQ